MTSILKRTVTSAMPLAIAMLGTILLTACDSNTQAGVDPDAKAPSPEDDLAAAIRQIDPARIIRAIEESPERYPVQYGAVTMVTPGTLAERIGITPGAWILKRGEVAMNRFKLNRLAGELVWSNAHGELRRDQVPDGACGFNMEILRNFTSWHVLHGNRNPNWDPYVVGALAVHERDPELAARFWERADQMGYPADGLSNLCRMNVACRLGDVGKAASFARAFGSLDKAPADLPLSETDWQQVTAVTGDPSWAAAATEFFEDLFLNDELRGDYIDVSDMLTMTSREPGSMPTAPPSELAKGMQRRSILPDFSTQSPWTANATNTARMLREMYTAATEAQRKGAKGFEPQPVSQSPDFMHKSWAGPNEKARDFDMTLGFRVSPIDVSSPSQYMREFHVGLANRSMHGGRNDAQVPPSARILSLCFGYGTSSHPGLSWIRASVPSRRAWSKLSLRENPFQLPGQGLFENVPDRRPKPGDPHTLRVVRVGNQVEAILDDRRIALVNVPPHLDEMGVCWFVSGVEVTIASFQADVLN